MNMQDNSNTGNDYGGNIGIGPNGELLINGKPAGSLFPDKPAEGAATNPEAKDESHKRYEVFVNGESAFFSDNFIGERVAGLLLSGCRGIDVFDKKLNKTSAIVPIIINTAVIVRPE